MSERSKLAITYKQSHHLNCCQSVLKAFSDKTDVSEPDLMKAGSCFGAGMGNMEGNCGALVGAEMMLGLINDSPKPPMNKAKALNAAFAERCGALKCRDLKGVDTGKVLCPCPKCIENAIDILEEILQ